MTNECPQFGTHVCTAIRTICSDSAAVSRTISHSSDLLSGSNSGSVLASSSTGGPSTVDSRLISSMLIEFKIECVVELRTNKPSQINDVVHGFASDQIKHFSEIFAPKKGRRCAGPIGVLASLTTRSSLHTLAYKRCKAFLRLPKVSVA